MALAALCLAWCVATHAAAWSDFDSEDVFPRLAVTHLAVCGVFAAAMATKVRGRRRLSRLSSALFLVGIVYVFANMAVMAAFGRAIGGRAVDRGDGSYVMMARKGTRPISEAEFHTARVNQIRLLGGWWVGFSAFALAMALSNVSREAAPGTSTGAER
ncbi:MAG: hypothetical protein H0V81_14810 [Solirubrobacterales bacterium]|nr:hypothetical protein [Solirubrobacterales bacterium]